MGDQVVTDHGKANLVFNNAGVALAGTVGDLSIEDYKWIMDINFYGVLYGTKAFCHTWKLLVKATL